MDFFVRVCVLPYKGYSLKVRDSGWRLASRAEALAQRRELCHVLHLHGANRCDLADGNVFLVKEDPADGRMGRVGESSTAKMEWVAVAKDLRRGVLVVDEDDLSSQRMFGWHLASEAEASRYDADIAVQLSQRGVDKDTSRLRVSDGVIFRGNTTPGDDVAATSRSSGKCVAVYKRPMIVAKSDDGVYQDGWRVATAEEARLFQHDIQDMELWRVAELVDGVFHGGAATDAKPGTVEICVPSSTNIMHVVIVKDTDRSATEGTTQNVLAHAENDAIREMMPMDELDSPQPFIVTDNDGRLTMVPKVRDFLKTLNHPLVVVSVAGVYRTGKSYLLNRLMNRQDGFPLGPTVQSKTKGIWTWVTKHPRFPDRALVLIDTEGLADPEKADSTHDIWIFSLAILLSNIFVFNSKGAIDNQSMHHLHLTTELSEHMRLRSGGSDTQDFSKVFPKFVWAVRDFFLQCEIEGKAVTPDEYLEWGLQLKGGARKDIQQANDVRASLKRFFPERHCFLFPFPTIDSTKLSDMDSVAVTELSPKFVEVGRDFVNFVLRQTDVKELEGKAVNGSMFVTLAECYIEAIRNGTIPCIQNAVDTMAMVENDKAMKYAESLYDKRWSDVKFPIPSTRLHDIHSEAQKIAVDAFVTRVIFDQDQKQTLQFGLLINGKLDELVAKNCMESTRKSRQAVNRLGKAVKSNMKSGTYLRSGGGGYEAYQKDMAELSKLYDRETDLGDEKAAVLAEFLTEQETFRMQVLNAETRLKEEERRTEMERLQREESERIVRDQEAEMKRLGQEQERREKDFKDGMNRLEQEMLAKAARDKADLEKRLKEDQKEKERLMRDGFSKEAGAMQQRMNRLTNDLAEKERQRQSSLSNLQQEMQKQLAAQSAAHAHQMEQLRRSIPQGRRRGGCFPASAKALLKSGPSVTMDKLRVGDYVLVGKSSEGRPVFEPVIGFMDLDYRFMGKFLAIFTRNGNCVRLSPSHLIFTVRDESLEPDPVYAKDLVVGRDSVISLISDAGELGKRDEVLGVHVLVQKGAFCPLTPSGRLVVDNALVSCYASFPHHISHFLVTPLRLMWMLWHQQQEKEGCHPYIAAMKRFGDFLGLRMKLKLHD